MMKLLDGTEYVQHVGKCQCLHSKKVHLETWQTGAQSKMKGNFTYEMLHCAKIQCQSVLRTS